MRKAKLFTFRVNVYVNSQCVCLFQCVPHVLVCVVREGRGWCCSGVPPLGSFSLLPWRDRSPLPQEKKLTPFLTGSRASPLPERELLQTHTCTPTQITTHRHSPGTRCLPERIWEDVCMCVRSNKSFPHLYSGRMQLWDKRVSHSISPSSYSPSLPSVPLSLSLLCN